PPGLAKKPLTIDISWKSISNFSLVGLYMLLLQTSKKHINSTCWSCWMLKRKRKQSWVSRKGSRVVEGGR
ncbi:hypothetical protein, partial [Streptococcus anginosus]|uniref:hypothetical protein n=1 Tax=Streptococcus anginosus TaxID=1328 RepID=UPI002EDA5C1C